MTRHIYHGAAVKRALHTFVVFKLINLCLAFGFQILVVKNLQPAEYATYAIFLGTLMSAQIFFAFGLDRTIQRFVPDYAQRGNLERLRALGARLGLIRLGSLVLFLLAFVVGAQVTDLFVAIESRHLALVAFAIWFIATVIFADGDALAQSCVAHVDLALVYTFEIVARTLAVLVLVRLTPALTADMVLAVSASTMTAAVVILYKRLWRIWQKLRDTAEEPPSDSRAALDINRVLRFATAAYVSALSGLASSPALVRLVATSGLNVVAFAAFSFAQGLFIAIQKGLPGALVLPSLEPLMAAELADRARHDRVFAALSFTVKVELIAVLVIVLITSVAGSEIMELIAKPEYAPYSFVMPALAFMVFLFTTYRILEIIGNLILKQKVFLTLWPLGLLSLLAIYLTVPQWGLGSVLLWPILENATKLAILLIRFRRDGAAKAFDLPRSSLLILIALLILGTAAFLRATVGVAQADLLLVMGSIALFAASLFAIRPFRPLEFETAMMILPQSWPPVRWLILRLTR
jgi:O-antigen/teichoic acid export membrane protein